MNSRGSARFLTLAFFCALGLIVLVGVGFVSGLTHLGSQDTTRQLQTPAPSRTAPTRVNTIKVPIPNSKGTGRIQLAQDQVNDAGFNPNANGTVWAIMLQDD